MYCQSTVCCLHQHANYLSLQAEISSDECVSCLVQQLFTLYDALGSINTRVCKINCVSELCTVLGYHMFLTDSRESEMLNER